MPKKQKNGLYRAQIMVHGQSVWLSAKTIKELEKKKEEMRCQLISGGKPKEYTFHELVKEWWNEIKIPTLGSESTVATYTSNINKWVLGKTSPLTMARAIRRVDIQRVLDKMRSAGLGAGSLSQVKHLFRDICLYGMEIGEMAADYTANCTIYTDEQTERKEALTPDQVTALFRVAPDHPLTYHAVLCMYYLGLRYGEAAGLTWADLDFDTGYVHIHQQRLSVNGKVGRTKTKAGVRDIPMPDEFVSVMRPLRQLPTVFVCPVQSHQAFAREWIRLLLDAGAARFKDGCPHQIDDRYVDKDYTPHQLRHTYVTVLYDAGIDPVTASRICGHTSYQTTADIYTSISESRKRTSADKIRAAFSNSCTILAQANSKNG